MGNAILRKSENERDLGVLVSSNGKFSEQCVLAAKKANAVLGMIKRNIKFKSMEVIKCLYKALVRPKLEYCVQAWSPYQKKDIDILERVQKRATKMISGFHKLSYEQRLQRLGLIKLEKCRTRGDLIQVYKLMTGIDNMDYKQFFEINHTGRTRGHRLKLVKKQTRLDIRKHFFSQRVVKPWNYFPNSVVGAPSLNSFKNRLDQFDKYTDS